MYVDCDELKPVEAAPTPSEAGEGDQGTAFMSTHPPAVHRRYQEGIKICQFRITVILARPLLPLPKDFKVIYAFAQFDQFMFLAKKRAEGQRAVPPATQPVGPPQVQPLAPPMRVLSVNESRQISSFQGLESPHDLKMRELMGRRWADMLSNSSSRDNSAVPAGGDHRSGSRPTGTPKIPVAESTDWIADVAKAPKEAIKAVELRGTTLDSEVNQLSRFDDESPEPVQDLSVPDEAPQVTAQDASPPGGGDPQPEHQPNDMIPYPPPQNPPANFELDGHLHFVPYAQMVDWGLFPATELDPAYLHAPYIQVKLFWGHLPGSLNSGVIQWLLEVFVRSGHEDPHPPVAYEPQLHVKYGRFRGCAHTMVATADLYILIASLHKRILFDHEGAWYAETDVQMAILTEYCARLRDLPPVIRSAKLGGLPCGQLTCEQTMQGAERQI